MIKSAVPPRLDLVLVGGGHAHVSVLRSFGMRPEPDVRLTLIAKELEAPYSGMLPGFVAGHYSRGDCHIDLVRLARFADARLIHGSATGIDRKQRRIMLEGRPPLAFDLLSIDVGITPALAAIKGAAEHGIAVKPISSLMPKLRRIEELLAASHGDRRFAVVGAGAAGFELAHAFRHRFADRAGNIHITLIGGNGLLPNINARARRLARESLERAGIALIESDPVVEIEENQVILASGRRIVADAALVTTGAAQAAWLRKAGLKTDADGFVAVRPTLQVVDDDDIFAAGDCAGVLEYPREKSGVFAVRHGPPLTENLRARAQGRVPTPFTPQRQYLMLLTTGRKHAIAARGPFSVAGDWVWTWKDWIDRRFMRKFNDLPEMAGRNGGEPDAMRCGGCAAKVGPVTLARALGRLDPGAGQRNDAAILEAPGNELRLETVDFFRAIWPEPYVFGEIAANHALNDIYAMGGRPTHALAVAVIPHARPRLVEEDLFQLLAGASAAFRQAGVELAGGHSSEGTELAAGFSVSGSVKRAGIRRKTGLRDGDTLILTRPLGTGLLFAAEMRGKAPAVAIAAALAAMRQSNREVARLLIAHGATAMTDVTGFGLLGHLIEMLEQSGCRATIAADDVPAYPQARELASAGLASTLLPDNLALKSRIEAGPEIGDDRFALLFDPQTAGGLLAGVPAKAAKRCLAELQAGPAPAAAAIGTVIGGAAKDERLVRIVLSA
ncbi:MAG: selenide, water dikinase SelD, partial [Hyphomicrobiales bacterium]